MFVLGSDRRMVARCIFIWNIRTGQQVYKVDRSRIGSECSPVSSLLALSDSRLVVGTQKHVITVYNYEKGTHEISSMHKEPVSSLVEINGKPGRGRMHQLVD